jgi:N-ethylmaleimide reductase
MSDSILFSPYRLGSIELKNRTVMSPMTRSRSPENVPGPLVAKYYAQRAEAGLIITEGTSPSPNGLGYARIPGIFSAQQVAGWKLTTKAVHDAGSRIVVQLMHSGRVGVAQNLPAGARVLGPSANATPGQMYTDVAGMQDFKPAAAMTEADIEAALAEYVQAGRNAVEAGFDGIELHGANGYLIEQFLDGGINQRTDRWGGSVENRARFALEAARRAAAAIGADKVGIRLSPYGAFNGTAADAHTDALYLHLAKELSALKLLYIHVVDHSAMGAPKPKPELIHGMRAAFQGTFILSGGYDAARAEADLKEKKGDLIAFGTKFLANPTLVTKLKSGAALTAPDMATFYTPGEKGYTDYP